MKYQFFLTLACFSVFFRITASGQYSNYYNVNSKLTSTVNQNVSGNLNVNKTITSIDYGSLAIANAQKEKNWLEAKRYNDDRKRMIAQSIAEDPTMAFEYGTEKVISTKNKLTFSKEDLASWQDETGFKHADLIYTHPSEILFSNLSIDYLQNKSKEGVITDILVNFLERPYEGGAIGLEKFLSDTDTLVGKEFEREDVSGVKTKVFYHKHTLSRATVFGQPGYRNTLIKEDKFEYLIHDLYICYVPNNGSGYNISIDVKTYGDKNEINFETLEGRRYYLRQLIEKVVSTALIIGPSILYRQVP